MAIDFLKRPLGVLDRIYNFVGGLKSVSSIQLTTPIQLVHDVSDQAGLVGPTTLGGWYFVWVANSHAVAGTLFNQIDPRASFPFTPDPLSEDYDIWFYDAQVIGDVLALTNASVIASIPAGGSVFAAATFALRFINQSAGGPSVGGQLYRDAGGTVQDPILLPPGTIIDFRSLANAALQADCFLRLWCGPRGARPPLG